jgi:hypothetical protein
MPIERRYERDVDLLLAEEFKVNSSFADSGRVIQIAPMSLQALTPMTELDA